MSYENTESLNPFCPSGLAWHATGFAQRGEDIANEADASGCGIRGHNDRRFDAFTLVMRGQNCAARTFRAELQGGSNFEDVREVVGVTRGGSDVCNGAVGGLCAEENTRQWFVER